MGKIQKLEQSLINKIAAGEVVERPASVVKELIENSIDAQAKKISIYIERAGVQKIQVIDDGIGMDEEDAMNCFEQHATSKISTADDLYSITTMGFRGEALSSISSVSKVTMITRSKQSETGIKIHVEGGVMIKNEQVAAPQGTNISIDEIFFNTPARKKFLKAEATELNHIVETFLNIACANCKVHLEIIHNSKALYKLPAATNLIDRLHDIYGKDLSENLIPVTYDSPSIKISGFTCHPSIARTRRAQQKVFINHRPIQDYLIAKAVSEGYGSTIPRDRFPLFFLFIEILPNMVDVNVHPRKLEVKFVNPQDVFKSVRDAVNTAVNQKIQSEQRQKFSTSTNDFLPSLKSSNTKTQHTNSTTYKAYTEIPKDYKIKQSLNFTKELLNDSQRTIKTITEQTFHNVIGQIFNTYILVESDGKLLITDQHAAAERITYEKLKKQYEDQSFNTQKLLIAETITLSEDQYEILEDKVHILKKFGIDIEPFGKNTFKIAELPNIITPVSVNDLFTEMVENVKDFDISETPDSVSHAVDHMLATLACHNSIRAGMKLERPQMMNLINDLLKCTNPYSCPHGRSIVWEITKNEIEKKVMRHN